MSFLWLYNATFYVICQGGFEDYLSCSLLHVSLNWTLAKLCIYGFCLGLRFHPIGLIIVVLAAWRVYTFWCIVPWCAWLACRLTWTVYELIDDTCDKIESGRRWLLQLLRVCFTPKTAKNQTLSHAADWWAEHLGLNYEFLLRWKSAKNTDCNKVRTVWTGGAWQDLKLIYDHP